jgi:bifunctional UDP-N-acetylglucosamine pyrophosphorylase/glucosamine-1-phosphate N-acetyltransferase
MLPQFNIVVLAAGKGKRMYSDLPKVLHPLAGQPLLHHVLRTAQSLQPATLTVVVGHGAEQVQAQSTHFAVQWALQAEQLGTGHAVQQALPWLDESCPTLVLYGDVPLTRAVTLQALLRAAAGTQVGILTIALPDPTGYGRIVRNHQGQITHIAEQKDASAAECSIQEINTGIMVLPTPFLKRALGALKNNNAQGEYYLTDIVALAVAEGLSITSTHPVYVWEVEGVNSKVQLAALERLHQRNLAQQLLEQGVTLADPSRLDIRGELICGRDVFIDVNCVFEGHVMLGEGVVIGANVVLRDVSLGAGTRIEPFTHIDGHGKPIRVGAHVSIGPFARLRPGAQLADQAHVGNFVEIKNSQIGQGSKVNHLSYIGDATVGARVNIGAGTITCNYDGANKHSTIIEDDAFIGSDTQLVAPVTVGRGATLGAGTTLTRDAPAGELTVSRPRQVTVPGWKRAVKKQS